MNPLEDIWKGQLNEAMSGMTTVFADALAGGDVKKFNENMKKGLYTEKDLAKVAAHMKTLVSSEQLANMLKAPDKVVQRMINAWGNLLMELNKAGFWDAMSSGIESVTEALTELAPKVKYAYGVISNLLKFVWENKGVLIPFAIGLRMVGSGIAIFTSAAAAGRVLSMASAFRVLGMSMVTAFLAPLAAITAVVLALDTYEAYTQHKKGLVADFRPVKQRDVEHARSNTLSDNLKSFAANKVGTQEHADAWRGIEGSIMSLRDSGQMSKMSLTERHAMAQQVLQATSKEHLSNGTEKFLMDIENEYRGRELANKDKEKLQRVGGGNHNVTINFTGVADPEAIKQLIVPAIQDTLRSNAQRDQAHLPNLLIR